MDRRANNLQVGQRNEYLVAGILAEQGFFVSLTHGGVAAYDMIIDHQGRLSRVQVKHTGYRHPESKGFTVSARRKLHKNQRYGPADCDFLVVTVLGYSLVYVIPVTEIQRGNLFVHPECIECSHTTTHRLERFRNAFDLMR